MAVPEIMWAPVSVCHHVSAMGQRPSPTTSKYQRQTSGLMGSPTLPRTRREERSCLVTHASSTAISDLRTVGAV